jgi:hypothetical protein
MKDGLRRLQTIAHGLVPALSTLLIAIPILFGIFTGGGSGGG